MPTDIKISCQELQDKFNRNEGGYPARIEELRALCVYDKPAHALSGQPPGTMSKVFKYFDGNNAVMCLQFFVLPSGEIGASGRRDPKRLLVGDTSYYCS